MFWIPLLAIAGALVVDRNHSTDDRYGLSTGPSGIRGMGTFRSFTPAEIAAHNRDQAAQGFRSVAVAPPSASIGIPFG